jgi:hypothetical protein
MVLFAVVSRGRFKSVFTDYDTHALWAFDTGKFYLGAIIVGMTLPL